MVRAALYLGSHRKKGVAKRCVYDNCLVLRLRAKSGIPSPHQNLKILGFPS
jgi:hypothetical protein